MNVTPGPLAGSPDSPSDARTEYTARLNIRRAFLALAQRQHHALGNVRLLLLFGSAAIAYAALSREALSAWWLAIPAALLVWLGTRLQRLESQSARVSRAAEFYERALARLDGDWAGKGETGERFLDEHHLYARDLDIFGHASLFELLCRARTRTGEETLAAWLLIAAPAETVVARQQAIRELALRLDLREDLAVAGEGARAGVHAEALIAWGEEQPVLEPSPFRAITWSLSVAGAIAVIAAVTYLVVQLGTLQLSENTLAGLRIYVLSVGAICLGVSWRFRRRTARIIEEVDKAGRDLGLLADLLKRLETEEFASPYLAAVRAQLNNEGKLASRRIARLNTFVELLAFRRNEIFKVIGPLLLWNVHLCHAVEYWRRTSGPRIRRWLTALGEMEAIASLATYSYEHPRHTFPDLVPESPLFEAEALGHPLLREDRVVPNDVSLGRELGLLVVSGSNMSGKSTLLRTIGVNAVLAQAGSPVCARRLRLSFLTVAASIRIQDSLQEGTSRFYAEISRVSRIMHEAETHPPVLFLVDEVLHGTNSHDRLIGAEAIVRGLVERGAIGLITTHDLALTQIATALGSHGANIHFQDYLENGRMRFDYRIRPGVVQHSNALELMRSVGLDV